jgi:hypothetical protein
MSCNRKLVATALAATTLAAGLFAAGADAQARPRYGAIALGIAAGGLTRTSALAGAVSGPIYVAEPGFQRCRFVARYDAQGNVADVVKACEVTPY